MKNLDKRNNEETYKDEGKHSKYVANHNFIHELEHINPLSINYDKYWKEIKRRCMEGFWAEGKWMPGNLYMYINLCRIRISKNRNSTTKTIGRPFLRDLEWEKAYVFMESRGFSGFTKDEEYTCYNPLKDFDKLDEISKQYVLDELPPEVRKPNGELKTYVSAREYLRRTHATNLGKPMFQNAASNVIDIEARGGGKSYWGANGIILNTWLMDGVYDYDDFCKSRDAGEPYSVDILVGAIDGKYTKDLLDKTALGITHFEGGQTILGKRVAPPLMKKSTGSWYSGKQYIENKFDVKIGTDWVTKGSGSKIYHRTFNNDPHAGNGIRTSVGVIEEVGFMGNLVDALGHMKDTTYDGARKYGSIYMFGTGGDMVGGSSEAALEVFTNPRDYDCLVFQDVWEETGDIGFFIPYEMTLNQFKDDEGITNMAAANRFVDKKRDDLNTGKSKKSLYNEMQNNPRTPSEAFLVQGGNIFPTAEIKDHLNWLKSHQTDPFVRGQLGKLTYIHTDDEEVRLRWQPDIDNNLRACFYRMRKEDDTTGCWQIWEHPQLDEFGEIPHGLYIAGTDPYDQDKAPNSVSLGSTFIYKTFMTKYGLYEWPVAEYTARPGTAEEHHEEVRKGLLYYNARNLYENERNTMKMHFSHKSSLYLLTKTPTILKATMNSNVQRTYGIHMTELIKDELEIYTRDWLKTDIGDGRMRLHMINSIPLLEELLNYNRIGNFDRVIAFMLVILNRLNNHKLRVVEATEENSKIDPFFARGMNGGFFK